MSSIIRISDSKAIDQQSRQLTAAEVQLRISLHTADIIERVSSVSTGDDVILIPSVEPQQKQDLHDLYGGATPEQRERLAIASHELAQALAGIDPNELKTEGAGYTIGKVELPMTHAMEIYIETAQAKTIETVTTNTLHMALDGAEADVYGLAVELKENLDGAGEVRTALADFRTTIAEWPEGAETQRFEWYELDDEGRLVRFEDDLTKPQAEAHMQNMEEALAQLSDIRQDFQLRLQDAQEKQQQIVQTMAAIMDLFHKTASVMIQNMKA